MVPKPPEFSVSVLPPYLLVSHPQVQQRNMWEPISLSQVFCFQPITERGIKKPAGFGVKLKPDGWDGENFSLREAERKAKCGARCWLQTVKFFISWSWEVGSLQQLKSFLQQSVLRLIGSSECHMLQLHVVSHDTTWNWRLLPGVDSDRFAALDEWFFRVSGTERRNHRPSTLHYSQDTSPCPQKILFMHLSSRIKFCKVTGCTHTTWKTNNNVHVTVSFSSEYKPHKKLLWLFSALNPEKSPVNCNKFFLCLTLLSLSHVHQQPESIKRSLNHIFSLHLSGSHRADPASSQKTHNVSN